MRRMGSVLVCLLLSCWAFPALGQEWENTDCLDCHADPDVVEIAEENPRPGLIFDVEAFGHSTHADFLCTDCHEGIADLPHEAVLPAVGVEGCAVCHGADEYLESVHGLAWLEDDGAAATCADCHGAHDVHFVDDPESTVFALRIAATCGQCHADQVMAEQHSLDVPDAYDTYLAGPHGEAVSRSGLLVAATCTDCHGGHDIWPSEEDRAFIHPQRQPETCGACHAGILEQYSDSIHGEILAAGGTGDQPAFGEDGTPIVAPTCATCHKPHESTPRVGAGFAAQAVQECQTCHAEYLDTFRGTYHGKVNALGYESDGEIAACTSCHTAHHILPASNPASSVSAQNVLGTCQQCHAGATEGFVGYRVHADPTNFEEYPLLFVVLAAMTTLLSTVMTVSLTHTALWYRRLRQDRLAAGYSPWARAGSGVLRTGPQVMRLSFYNRVLHILVMSSFLLLVVTGMPLHFAEAAWAQRMMALFGGFKTAAFLHRVGAVITLVYAVLHVGNLLHRRWVQGEKGIIFGEDTLVPRLRDAQEAFAHIKWFFNRGPRPEFGRWAYWEKFDYFAVFFGVTVIGSTGLVLWFPEFFTRYLPGWVVNVATIVHSDEALLATSFIFTVHFFNAHLRPGKFPMDPVFLTGRTTLEEMKHEHPREYERLEAAGAVEDAIVEPASEVTRHWAKLIGYPAILIGLTMFFMVIATLLAHLLG